MKREKATPGPVAILILVLATLARPIEAELAANLPLGLAESGLTVVEVVPLVPDSENDVPLEMELWVLSDGRVATHGRFPATDLETEGPSKIRFEVDRVGRQFSARRVFAPEHSKLLREAPSAVDSNPQGLGGGGPGENLRCYEAYLGVTAKELGVSIARALIDITWDYDLTCVNLVNSYLSSCRKYRGTGFKRKHCIVVTATLDKDRIQAFTDGLWRKEVGGSLGNIDVFINTEIQVYKASETHTFTLLSNSQFIGVGEIETNRLVVTC